MNKTKFDRILKIVSIALMIVCLMTMTWLYSQINTMRAIMAQHSENRGELSNITAMMEEIQSIYEKEYIGEEIDKEQLEDSALLGFTLGHNDRYGYYMSPTDSKEQANTRKEKLVGIGVEVVYEEGKGYYVSKIYDNSPAKEAGVEVGDYLTSANGTSIEEVNKDEFIDLVRGEEGTLVNIGIDRENETKHLEIERQNVRTNSVSSRVMDGIAYIKIGSFTEYTDEEFIDTINSLTDSGVTKFIFDLRNNTGGAAESVIKMLDYLLPEGLIARFEEKDSKDNIEYYSDKSEINADMVVLVNKATASASELFSKALQDYGKATIIGTNTFGKGTVLSTYTLSNGGTLTLSTAKYYTISGEEIEGNGVKLDILIELPLEKEKILYKLNFEEDEQMQKALEILNSK